MTSRALRNLLFVALGAMGMVSLLSCAAEARRSVFSAPNGDKIELDIQAGKFQLPGVKEVKLRDCSDEYQTCFTDDNGFAFSYFKKCGDAALDLEYKGLQYTPRIFSVVHGDLWFVFDESPKYMFHYSHPTGIRGIYMAQSPVSDFLSLRGRSDLKLTDFDLMHYRIAASDTVAACKQ